MTIDWNWIGAKWWKFDFHNHTPASTNDYGKGPNQAQLLLISPKDWLLGYMKAEIDCVAITDHNSGAWIDKLKQALTALANEKHAEYRPLYLFPGMEINVQGNIHILAIFPCDKTTSDIDSLIGAVEYNGTKGTSDAITVKSAVQVIDTVIKFGGLAIPAHVDQGRGLFKDCTGNTLQQILAHNGVIAAEVIDTSQAKPQLYIDKKLNWSEVIGTDSHHPAGNGTQNYPGSRFTWVKMSKPSFDGLRLALIDGKLSLKRSDQFSDDPNMHGQLAIESIVVNEAKYLGRGESFTCQLNPWLNTIIGGRGTGKSTVLEFLRIALDRKKELPKTLEKEFEKYSQTSTGRQDEGLLIDTTVLTVYFRKDGVRFRIKWDNAVDKYLIEEEIAPETWYLTEGDIAQRFPVRIYSQKQIFELAKHPQALLHVVDDAPDVNYRDWKAEWEELITKYLSIRSQEREVQAGLHEESVIKGQLDDVKRKLEVFEKAGHADILKSYQLRQNQSKTVDSWGKAWADTAEQVRTLATSLMPPEIDQQHFSIDKEEDKELLDAVTRIRLDFQIIQSDMQKIVGRIHETLKSWQDKKPALKIYRKIMEADQEYTKLRGQLSAVGAGDPMAYGQLVKQRQDIEEKLKGFNKKREIIVSHKKNAKDCLTKIYEHRSKITKLRDEFLKNTLDDNPHVRINVIPYGSKETVEEEFRNLINRGDGGFEKDIGSIDGTVGLLSLLSQDAGQTMEQCIENFKSKLFDINANVSAEVADKRFASYIQSLAPEQIDRFRCWFPEDSLNVHYSLKDGGVFMPVKQGSPGQKTAALLAFILSYGIEPLVLDQPEDDLDNHLIYNLIVNELREIKQRRQVLIVTHNANIVVNGDAENVVALDVRDGQTKIVKQDGLQEQSVRDEICRVMEGGKEAFDQRYKRLNAGR